MRATTTSSPKIDHLSASQLTLYQNCSLKYRFQYVDLLPKPFRPSGLAFGSSLHSALDWFHREKIRGNGISLERLLKVFEADWFGQGLETEIRYKDGETDKGLMVMGKQMLTQYFHAHKDRPVGAEVPFSLPLIELATGEVLGPNLEGKMDLIEEDTIVEFKTSAQTLNAQGLRDSLQLTCYGYAYRLLFQQKPRVFRVVDFVKTKTPKMTVLETTREERDYRRLFYLAKEVLSGISAGVFFPNPSFRCSNCEYEHPCQEWLGNGHKTTSKEGGLR